MSRRERCGRAKASTHWSRTCKRGSRGSWKVNKVPLECSRREERASQLTHEPLQRRTMAVCTKEKKANRQPKRGIGEEDRVHTCTSRILEGRSGGQVGLSCSYGPKILFGPQLCGVLLTQAPMAAHLLEIDASEACRSGPGLRRSRASVTLVTAPLATGPVCHCAAWAAGGFGARV